MLEYLRMQKNLLIPGIALVVILFFGAAYLMTKEKETTSPSVASMNQEV
jgi:hypothetical protein